MVIYFTFGEYKSKGAESSLRQPFERQTVERIPRRNLTHAICFGNRLLP
jgi:hypothetical protein